MEQAVEYRLVETKEKAKIPFYGFLWNWHWHGFPWQEHKVPPPPLYFELGRVMTLHTTEYNLPEKITLSDGTVIKENDPVGKIDIFPEEKFVKPGNEEEVNKAKRRYAAEIAHASRTSLKILAMLCREDRRLDNIKAFGGYSLIARIAPGGFDVLPIKDRGMRETFCEESYEIEKEYSANTNDVNFLDPEKEIQQAWISREELIRRYAPKPQPVLQGA